MKLRYYLRGLGIGMLVAALVLILSGKTGGMSDEAVKRRASELGMVEKNKSVLEDIDDEPAVEEDKKEDMSDKTDVETVSDPGDEAQAELTDPSSEEVQAADQVAEGEEAVSGDGSTQEVPVQAEDAGQAQAEGIEQRADEVADRAEEIADNAPEGQVITFTVVQGDTSISVARRAQEAGLVGSAIEFDRFLCQNGYERRISIGTYEIRLGETEKEIADKITKSR